jgi:tellurite resistance protein TehA-like permease
MEMMNWFTQQSPWVWVVTAVGTCAVALLWAVAED